MSYTSFTMQASSTASPPAVEVLSLPQRQQIIDVLIDPLPGRTPRDRFKRIEVPAECDGQSMLAAACRAVPHVAAEIWQRHCAGGLVVDAEDRPIAATHIVRAGEVYRRKYPALVEPDVDMRVRLLYEDEALIVIDKPAPLPMHASGRFYLNTLQYVLERAYYPQKPQAAHRLDANTTGVAVIARTGQLASKVQTQFDRRQIEKRYLVRMQGQPEADAFVCEAPISKHTAQMGTRFVDEHGSGLAARTEFRVIQRNADGTALLEARPLTGRTNQIRIHLWHLGWPVCGDLAYLPQGHLGESQTLKPGDAPLCLHAWKISLRHPLTRQMIDFTAPPPAWVATPTNALE